MKGPERGTCQDEVVDRVLLADLAAVAPDARVVVARELTKLHEELVRGTASDLAARFAEKAPKGEVTVVFAPAEA